MKVSPSVRPNLLSAVCIFASLVWHLPAFAHHSFQAFDMQQMLVFEGVLTEYSLTNPHGFFSLEVTDDQGQVQIWTFETVNGSTLRRLGITEDTFELGGVVSIEAHPPRNPERRFGAAELITRADGAEFALSLRRAPRPAEPPEPAYANSIEGIWMGPEISSGLFFIGAAAMLENWPLTQLGRQAVSEYDGSQSPSAQCVPYAPPAVLLVPAPIEIEFGESLIEFRIPNEGAVRTVYMDGRTHPENGLPTNQGHSIGHWEDGILVVDTQYFEEHRIGNGFGLPSGSNKHLSERFSLNADGSKLDYSFVLQDSEYLTAPLTYSVQWTYSPDSSVDILDCDPEAARRFLEAY